MGIKSFGVASALLITTGFFLESAVPTASAQASISSSTRLRYAPDTGTLRVITRFNRRVRGNCRINIRGGISYEGDTTFTSNRKVLSSRFTRGRKISFRVTDLNGASNNEMDLPPILSVQTRVTCDNREVVVLSSVDARYVNCGVGRRDLAPDRFLEELNTKLRELGL